MVEPLSASDSERSAGIASAGRRKEHAGTRESGAQQSPRTEKDFFVSFFIRKKNIKIMVFTDY